MGSATREALAQSRTALASQAKITLATAEELLAAGRAIGDSAQLRALLSGGSSDASERAEIVASIFGSRLGSASLSLLTTMVDSTWSSPEDLLAGIEEIGIRAIAEAAPSGTPIDRELFAFSRIVASNPELELALGDVRSDGATKAAIVTALLEGKASASTLAIVREIVQQPRGRRIRQTLNQAARIVADQADTVVGVVTSAQALPAAQLTRLQKELAVNYGRGVHLNEIVDPALIGGIRIQIGDDVIDGSVAARIKELRLRLAG